MRNLTSPFSKADDINTPFRRFEETVIFPKDNNVFPEHIFTSSEMTEKLMKVSNNTPEIRQPQCCQMGCFLKIQILDSHYIFQLVEYGLFIYTLINAKTKGVLSFKKSGAKQEIRI